MEETLGKRIAWHRKHLGLTQDALAEQLGVTAQAVSKWENDQSCPDIAMLPKLSAIFRISIDELLGVVQKEESNVVVTEPLPIETVGERKIPGRKTERGFALWLLLVGGILLAMELLPVRFYRIDVWKAICLSGLLGYGILGLYPRFSVFRLGCALGGGYYLWCGLTQPHIMLNEELLIPILLVFFGLGLLVDRPREKARLSIDAVGQNVLEYRGNSFVCSTGFGRDRRAINLPILEGGEGNVYFGDLEIDLHDCGDITQDCRIVLKCAFGTMTVYVPRKWRMQCVNRNFFGHIQESGSAGENAEKVLLMENDAAFGEITIKYV